MSIVASNEVAQQNKNLALEIDWRLDEVAKKLPHFALQGAPEEEVVFYQRINVGWLSCTDSGAHGVIVTARLYGHDDQLGFWKEYGCPPAGKRTVERLSGGMPTDPSELDDCPDASALRSGLRNLYEGYLGTIIGNHGQLVDAPIEDIYVAG